MKAKEGRSTSPLISLRKKTSTTLRYGFHNAATLAPSSPSAIFLSSVGRRAGSQSERRRKSSLTQRRAAHLLT